MERLTICVVLVLVVGALPPVVAGATVNASITGVDVSPAAPAPGETITFTPTIRNSQSSSDVLEIRAVALRRSSGSSEYTRISDLGTLSPDSSIDVPLTYTFDSPGTRDLRVIVYGYNPNRTESVRLQYPVTVDVRDRHPQLAIDASDSVDGVLTNGTVTVANGLDTRISNVEVTVSGVGVRTTENRRVFASIQPNGTRTAPFRFRPETPGPHELTARIRYTVDGDVRRTTTVSTLIETETLADEVILDASAVGSGENRALAVDVVNRGNAPIEDVSVTAASPNATLRRALLERVDAGTVERVRLNATLTEPRADVTVRAEYEIADRSNTATTAVGLQSTPGAIELSGIDVTNEDDRLQLSGSAANVGLTEVDSVIVRVVPADGVTPAFPNKEYFVGTVPASDFVSFDVYASVDENVTAVPLVVTYLVDGDRKQQRFAVDVSDLDGDSEQQSGGNGSWLSTFGPVIAVGVAGVVVVGYLLFRQSRRNDDELDL
jgi:hypothetical protein